MGSFVLFLGYALALAAAIATVPLLAAWFSVLNNAQIRLFYRYVLFWKFFDDQNLSEEAASSMALVKRYILPAVVLWILAVVLLLMGSHWTEVN
jgi:hypothetical protein